MITINTLDTAEWRNPSINRWETTLELEHLDSSIYIIAQYLKEKEEWHLNVYRTDRKGIRYYFRANSKIDAKARIAAKVNKLIIAKNKYITWP